ncbi:hypothetical protein HYFRA_00000414 [Hymenoscyphus fraxineus]|uniref:MATE efflux family protein n=1 Tax=Hymenoscyphus fraxineus TaxID=746836 RepID=A0A9N9PW95_9HELO|nr:hypothetical protein HYFRA_00000414 [Hymenoscyphus fraxineus]
MPPSETTTLLRDQHQPEGLSECTKSKHQKGYQTIEHTDSRLLETNNDFDTTWKVETKALAKNSAPLVLTYLLQYSYNLVMVYVAGKLGTSELGAASLATMTANITGLCVYEGLATSLDTLASQAFGAGKKKLVGRHVQRMWLLMLVATIPIGALWLSSPWILQLLVPDANLAKLAGSYLRLYLLGAPGFAMFEAGKRFMQAQGNFTACLMVVMVCAPLNILWNWLFVFRFGLGFRGAGLAVALSNTLQPILLLLYINLFARSMLECWPRFSLAKVLQNWGEMIRLGIPGIFMVLSEWLAFEILTFASSYMGNQPLAAQSVLFSVAITTYHIPMPTSVAASTRFGNLIGHGALTAARKVWRIYYIVFVGIGLFDLTMLTLLRRPIANFFTEDPTVRDIIVSVLPIVAANQMFDAFAILSSGLLRGMGRQRIGGWINLGVYYIWAVPLSLFLAFGPLHMGVFGLWIGPLSGLGIVAGILTLYMRYTDWQKVVAEARARVEE